LRANLLPSTDAATTTHSSGQAGAPREALPLGSAVATVLCAAFGLAGWAVGPGDGSFVLYVLSYMAGGTMTTVTAVTELTRLRLTVDLLMILAAVGAAVLGDWGEGAVLLFLFSLSNTLEAYAMYRTTRSIDALIRLRPREACLVRDGVEARVEVEALNVGDLIRVRPGERFPVDGEVMEGETWADEATLTGESEPVPKALGSLVFAGTINGRGSPLIHKQGEPAAGPWAPRSELASSWPSGSPFTFQGVMIGLGRG